MKYVYIIFEDDGNVCCPADKVFMVVDTQAAADAVLAASARGRYPDHEGLRYRVYDVSQPRFVI